MRKGDEITAYKNKVIDDILNTDRDGLSEDIINAIDPEFLDDRYSLVYKNIFPYLMIPNTQTETKSYITMSVDMPRVSTKNYFFKDMLITLNVIVHESLINMEDESATRADYISSKLNKIFNNNTGYGNQPLEYVSDVESVITVGNTRFYTRSMRFSCNELNATRC